MLRSMQSKNYPDFEKNQWLPKNELFEIQNKLLRKLIEEANANVPFWRRWMKENDLSPEQIKNADSLEKLPVTSKAIMLGRDEFISENLSKMSPQEWSTGGSTGQMLKYYTTKRSRYATLACIHRAWAWGGYHPDEKLAVFTGGGLGSRDLTLNCVGMNEEIMDDFIKRIQKSKVTAYRGIPSGVMTFARHVEKRGVDLKKKCVLTTSENLMPAHRKFIGEVLGEVYDGYGANDGGSSAFECGEHNGWHISADKSIFEVLDKNGERVAPGEEGILTVTCLFNHGMPWIRYMSNDLAVLSDEKCACGRGLPLMSKLLGRTTDILRTDNTIINGTELANNTIGLGLPMKAFKFIQKGRNLVVVRIVPEEGWTEEHEAKLISNLHRYDDKIEARMEYPDEIPLTPAGKSRYIINEVDTED